mgnify:CR=1 FL=1
MFSCLDMKRTTETKTESKLGTGLEHKTLKFTDYAIFKFQSDFIYFINFNTPIAGMLSSTIKTIFFSLMKIISLILSPIGITSLKII